jgi:hypothetical protein
MATKTKKPKKGAKKPPAKPITEAIDDHGATFDMYHFFSRWDVVFGVVILTLLLLYMLAHHFAPHAA